MKDQSHPYAGRKTGQQSEAEQPGADHPIPEPFGVNMIHDGFSDEPSGAEAPAMSVRREPTPPPESANQPTTRMRIALAGPLPEVNEESQRSRAWIVKWPIHGGRKAPSSVQTKSRTTGPAFSHTALRTQRQRGEGIRSAAVRVVTITGDTSYQTALEEMHGGGDAGDVETDPAGGGDG